MVGVVGLEKGHGDLVPRAFDVKGLRQQVPGSLSGSTLRDRTPTFLLHFRIKKRDPETHIPFRVCSLKLVLKLVGKLFVSVTRGRRRDTRVLGVLRTGTGRTQNEGVERFLILLEVKT